MQSIPADTLQFISSQLDEYSANAYVPFSQQRESALIVLPDGQWIPGVRVESASYSLTIPPILNAYTTMRSFDQQDIALVCTSRPFKPEELTYLKSLGAQDPYLITDQICGFTPEYPEELSNTPMQPALPNEKLAAPEEGIQKTRTLTSRAHVPHSDFPVACILETNAGQLIPGVNVEHADWSRILCAERNALSTAITYGIHSVKNIYLTCTRDTNCSPCGACRQLLAELTPDAVLWMDRGLAHEESATPEALLPAWFTGSTLINNMTDC